MEDWIRVAEQVRALLTAPGNERAAQLLTAIAMQLRTASAARTEESDGHP